MLTRLKQWWANSPTINKIEDWSWHSLTVAWAFVKIGAGSVLLISHEVFDYLSTILTDDGVKSAIAAMNFPAYVGLGLAIIGCITLAARLRKGSTNPVVMVAGGSEPT